MAWGLAESLVNDVVTHLESNFSTTLADIDTELADGITMEDVTAWEVAEEELQHVADWPKGLVVVSNTNIREWRGEQIKGLHDVTIAVLALDQDKSVLRRRIYRYGRAIMEEIGDMHGDVAFTWDVGVKGAVDISFSPLFTVGENRFVADIQVDIKFQKTEART